MMKSSLLTSLARLALAFAISPLVAALLLASLWWIEDRGLVWRTHSMFLQDTIVFSYMAVVLFGLPLAALFALLRWKRWWQYALTGLVLGTTLMVLSYRLVPVSEMSTAGGEDYYQRIDWPRSLTIGLIASTTALVFWWLRFGEFHRNIRKRNPSS